MHPIVIQFEKLSNLCLFYCIYYTSCICCMIFDRESLAFLGRRVCLFIYIIYIHALCWKYHPHANTKLKHCLKIFSRNPLGMDIPLVGNHCSWQFPLCLIARIWSNVAWECKRWVAKMVWVNGSFSCPFGYQSPTLNYSEKMKVACHSWPECKREGETRTTERDRCV